VQHNAALPLTSLVPMPTAILKLCHTSLAQKSEAPHYHKVKDNINIKHTETLYSYSDLQVPLSVSTHVDLFPICILHNKPIIRSLFNYEHPLPRYDTFIPRNGDAIQIFVTPSVLLTLLLKNIISI
jgi:hypothetical protein